MTVARAQSEPETDAGHAGGERQGAGDARKKLGAGVLGLLLVDKLHQNALVLEDVTLALEVEVVVHVAVNLARGAVLAQKAAEDALAADPQNLGGHTGVGRTAALACGGGGRAVAIAVSAHVHMLA